MQLREFPRTKSRRRLNVGSASADAGSTFTRRRWSRGSLASWRHIPDDVNSDIILELDDYPAEGRVGIRGRDPVFLCASCLRGWLLTKTRRCPLYARIWDVIMKKRSWKYCSHWSVYWRDCLISLLPSPKEVIIMSWSSWFACLLFEWPYVCLDYLKSNERICKKLLPQVHLFRRSFALSDWLSSYRPTCYYNAYHADRRLWVEN